MRQAPGGEPRWSASPCGDGQPERGNASTCVGFSFFRSPDEGGNNHPAFPEVDTLQSNHFFCSSSLLAFFSSSQSDYCCPCVSVFHCQKFSKFFPRPIQNALPEEHLWCLVFEKKFWRYVTKKKLPQGKKINLCNFLLITPPTCQIKLRCYIIST